MGTTNWIGFKLKENIWAGRKTLVHRAAGNFLAIFVQPRANA